MADEKPLFIPLKREHFEAFKRGDKDIEWRRYGKRWNERVAHDGRCVTLSLGYSGERLHGVVTTTSILFRRHAPESAQKLFPVCDIFAAIRIQLDEPTRPEDASNA